MSRFYGISETESLILEDIINEFEKLDLIELLGEYNYLQKVIKALGLSPMRQLIMQNLTQMVERKLI